MTRFKRNLRQDVTHWPVTGSDGFGGFTFGAPTLLKGRWEEKAELFLTQNNEEVVSKAIVYLGVDVDEGDFLCLGDYTTELNPTTFDGPYRVRGMNRSTNLRNLVALRKVFL